MQVSIEVPKEILDQLASEGTDLATLVRSVLRSYAIRSQQAKIDVLALLAARDAAAATVLENEESIRNTRDRADADAEIMIAKVE
jgi:hypothetical protein